MAPAPRTASELVIDLAAVRANWRRLGESAPGAQVAAVVKADAYGLGAIPVVQALADEGCTEFFVAEVSEGIELREALPEVDIFVLAGAQPGTTEELIAHDLAPVLISAEQIERWTLLSGGRPNRLRCSLHLDTGMNRTGLDAVETAALLADTSKLQQLEVVHVMSHLASADDPDTTQNEHQLAAYHRIRAGLPMGVASLANTPGIALGPAYHFDHVRPGIGLYGCDPSPGNASACSRSFTSARRAAGPHGRRRRNHRLQSDHTTAGSVVLRPSGWATATVSFEPSQPRPGCVRRPRRPIVGRVSMDLITVDISDLPTDIVVTPDPPLSSSDRPSPSMTSPRRRHDLVRDPTSLGRRYRRLITDEPTAAG